MKQYLVKYLDKSKKYQAIESKTDLIINVGGKTQIKELANKLNGGVGFCGWTPFFMVRKFNEHKVEKKNKAST